MSYFLGQIRDILLYFVSISCRSMKKILFACILLLVSNLLKSQKVDSLISIKNSPFLKDLTQRNYIPESVEIENPFAELEEYEMVRTLGARILKMDSNTFIHFNGSGLLYQLVERGDSTLLFKRLDKTNNFKYNINATVYSYKGKIFNLGGYGFWRTTGTLRCFNEKNKEWDVVPTNVEIHVPIKSGLTSYYPKQSKLFIPFQIIRNDGIKENRKNQTEEKNVYVLNLASNDWEKLGETNPELIKMFNDIPWQLPTEDGLIFSHKNTVYHLRYLTNEVYIFNQNSSLAQTLERIYNNHYKYCVNSTLYYQDKITGEYDSLKIPLNEFVKSDMQIWKKHNFQFTYGAIPVILIIAFLVIRKKTNKENKATDNISTTNVTSTLHSIKAHGHAAAAPVIRFSETEKQLLQLILEKSKKNRTTSITEINYVLGIKDKNISLQKKVRSEVMNSINEKFSFVHPHQNQLIANTRSLEDKRYFEYFTDESNFERIESILNEEN